MTQPAQPPVQGEPTNPPAPTDQQPPTPPENQSPYADYLEKVPEGLRPVVEPTFKEWDANVTQRFQELHSQYEPWKQVTDQYQPDDVMGALQVASVLEEDPERFLAAFVEAYPELAQKALQGQGGTQQPPSTPPSSEQGLSDLDPEDPVAQRIKSLEDQISQLTGTFTEQQQREQQQASQQYLDQVLSQLHEQHGDFDDTFILSQIAFANRTPDQAIQAWNETKTKYMAPPPPTPPAPPVISANGGIPSTVPEIEGMDRKETTNLVAQLLEQAAREGQ